MFVSPDELLAADIERSQPIAFNAFFTKKAKAMLKRDIRE